MQLNMVNELNKPKKVLTYTVDPNVTAGDLVLLLDQDKLINLQNHNNNVQVWLNMTKILLSNKTLASYNISAQDTLFLLPQKEIAYDEGDSNIQQMKKLGCSKEEILAALAMNENDAKLALNSLLEEYQKKQEEEGEEADNEEEVEEEFKDVQPLITQALDTLSEMNPNLYSILGENENKLRDFCESFKHEYFAYFADQDNVSEEDTNNFINLFLHSASNDRHYLN